MNVNFYIMSIVSRMFKRISKIYLKKLQTVTKIAKISSFKLFPAGKIVEENFVFNICLQHNCT